MADRAKRDGRASRARTAGRALADTGVGAVALAMVDNAGVTRVKCVPVARLEDAARFGIGLSTVFAVFIVDDAITSALGVEGPSGDMRLVPDPDATVALAAMPGWAWAPVDQYDQEGGIWPGCGRSYLRRMAEGLARRGIDLRAAFEVEFFLGHRGERGPGLAEEPDPVAAHHGPGYSAIVLTKHQGFGLDLIRALESQGTGIQQFHPEYSTGQFEVSIPPRDAIGAADTNLLLRQTIRSVAHNHGLDASFSPVIWPGLVGNGCHLHFSLWDKRGRNLFAGGRGPEGMTRQAESFTAGVLAELPALVAVTCPSVPSYLRLQPHRWAGAFTCWGRENREAALRFITGMVGSRDTATNMELKSIDGAGNPYLVLGSVIAAGLSGLERRLQLPKPTTDDPASLPAKVKKAMGIRRLPASLGEAIEELERSSVLREAMGDLLFESFLATRRAELDKYGDMDDEAAVRAHRWRY